MKTLSERLNHALQLTGVTQSELARRIGIKQQSISQICSGKSARSRYTMQIAEALRVNAHWLATGDGEIGCCTLCWLAAWVNKETRLPNN